jgi:hypothetical protein
MVQNLNESEMALFGVLRLRALEMYLTPPTLSERRFFVNYCVRSAAPARGQVFEHLEAHRMPRLSGGSGKSV